MSLLRAFARVVGVVWLVVLALFGLGVAMYCVDALVSLGSIRPDRLLHLPSVRQHVGRFLGQIAAPGLTAGLALLCGLAAILLGILLLTGVLGRRNQRLAVLEQAHRTGVIAARRRPLADMARSAHVRRSWSGLGERPGHVSQRPAPGRDHAGAVILLENHEALVATT